MNPFTRFLKQWTSNQSLEEFVAHWDKLEMVTIRVYREKMTIEEATPLFEQSWPWLKGIIQIGQVHYGRIGKKRKRQEK